MNPIYQHHSLLFLSICSRLTKGRTKARQRKMHQIAQLLELPGNVGPSCPSPPSINLHSLRKEAAAQSKMIVLYSRMSTIQRIGNTSYLWEIRLLIDDWRTNQAQRCLTSVIVRKPVFPRWSEPLVSFSSIYLRGLSAKKHIKWCKFGQVFFKL